MATYTNTTAVPNGQTLFDVFTKSGSGSGLSTFAITNPDGTVTTFTGNNLTWSGNTATAGAVTSIVRRSADGTITYDQITNFTPGVNDSFQSIWNPTGQAVRAGYIFVGADTHTGGTGNDFFRGYNGIDTFNGGDGNDQVGYDLDFLAPGAGGGAIIVNLSASTQMGVISNRARDGFGNNDILNSIEEARGTGLADFFFGSTTYNLFQGRGGADTYDGGNTVAFFKGLAGTLWNWADYRQDGGTSGINITLTDGTATPGIDGGGNTAGSGTDTFGATETFININSIRGSNAAGAAGNDTVNGNSFFNHFEGLSGADTFDGNGGSDRYSYNNESRFGGSTTRGVLVNLSGSAVTLNGVSVAAQTGIDTFNGATGFVDSLIDVEEINGTNQADFIQGNQFDNKFFLFNGNDEATLGRGFDYVEPGAGNDIIHGEAGAGLDQSYEDRDEISYDDFGANGVGVYIDLNANTFVDPTGGTDTVFDIERLRGTSSADTLIGADAANQREEMYRGLGGNDIIDGRNGYDIADYSQDASNGGTGGIIANLSTSEITVGAFTVAGGTVRDGFGATDTIYYIEGIRGTTGNDTMVGGAGNDQFRPMGGTDSFNGGDGIDQVEMYFGDVFTGLGGIVNLASTSFTFSTHTVAANTARQFDGGIVTLTSVEVASGSFTDDGINGSEARDSINGFLGDDTIFGNGGDDVINGHQGANTLDGGAGGFDTVSFMYDKTMGDYLVANFPGNGFVVWGGVTVNLGGNSATGFDGETSTLTNFEAVTGTFVDDSITGDGFDNTFRGLSGNDTMDGAGGNDTVNYSPTNQDGRILVPIVGVNYSEPNVVRVNLTGGTLMLGGVSVAAGKALDGEGGTDTLSNIENVTGSIGDDFIAASLVSNVIDGWTGNDTVYYAGVEADYTIIAGNGGWQVARTGSLPLDSDFLRNVETLQFLGGGPNRTLAPVGLTETGGAQGDEITGVQGNDDLEGGGGDDLVDGGQGSDNIEGGAGDDELTGGDGDDTVDGGANDDTIIAGSGQGNDTYIGGSGSDTAIYTSTTLGIVVDLDVPGNPGGGAGTATGSEINTDQLSGIENVVGGQGSDSITGDGQANNLQGVAGADQLFGEGGNDTLQGGSGNDSLNGGADDDSLFGDSDDDTLKGGAGADFIDGGANSLTGGDTADFSDATGSVVATLGADGDAVVTAAGIGTDTLVRIENLTGGNFDDTLTGNLLDNVLVGGAGNDEFYVDNAGDIATESVGQGNDRVWTSVGYTLNSGSEIETFTTTNHFGTTAINLTGNAFAQFIMGNDGDNIINGAGGIDTMVGRLGNDQFYVDNVGDIATESVSQGNDRVWTSVNYTLNSGSEIETFTTTDHTGTTAINLTGNAFGQFIMGNDGGNIINGAGGIDTMVGRLGDDQFYVDNTGDIATESVGQGIDRVWTSTSFALNVGSEIEIFTTTNHGGTTAINLTGNAFGQFIMGNDGSNVINGGAGSDTLVSRAGSDTYLFNTGLGPSNIDDLIDFSGGNDIFNIDDAVFSGLSTGMLSANAFFKGTAAHDADDRIIYNSSTGALFFDADGTGGIAAQQFANITAGIGIDNSYFIVV